MVTRELNNNRRVAAAQDFAAEYHAIRTSLINTRPLFYIAMASHRADLAAAINARHRELNHCLQDLEDLANALAKMYATSCKADDHTDVAVAFGRYTECIKCGRVLAQRHHTTPAQRAAQARRDGYA